MLCTMKGILTKNLLVGAHHLGLHDVSCMFLDEHKSIRTLREQVEEPATVQEVAHPTGGDVGLGDFFPQRPQNSALPFSCLRN